MEDMAENPGGHGLMHMAPHVADHEDPEDVPNAAELKQVKLRNEFLEKRCAALEVKEIKLTECARAVVAQATEVLYKSQGETYKATYNFPLEVVRQKLRVKRAYPEPVTYHWYNKRQQKKIEKMEGPFNEAVEKLEETIDPGHAI